MRLFSSVALSCSALLTFAVANVACGAAGGGKVVEEKKEAAPAVEGDAKPQAHGAPTQAHDGGMPPGHPPMAGGPMAGGPMAGPMMGKAPGAAPAAPVNPQDVTPSGETKKESFAELSAEVPTEWSSRPPKSNMRLAELVIPGPGGETPLAIYRFPGGAGGVDANIARWKGQFVPPEGKTIDDVTKVAVDERGSLKITRIDIQGTNNAEVMPGEAERHNAPGSRMLAAIVEGSGDPFFFKAVGPSATLDLWAPAFESMLATAAVGG